MLLAHNDVLFQIFMFSVNKQTDINCQKILMNKRTRVNIIANCSNNRAFIREKTRLRSKVFSLRRHWNAFGLFFCWSKKF